MMLKNTRYQCDVCGKKFKKENDLNFLLNDKHICDNCFEVWDYDGDYAIQYIHKLQLQNINSTLISEGDVINFICLYDKSDYEVIAYSDDLELSVNKLLVINNTLLKTKSIRNIKDNHYEVLCELEDGLIVEGNTYFGLQSDLD